MNLFLKNIFRNIIKDKTYSTINIMGLAFGLACVIFIYLWVRNEVSYNRFHKNVDNLYMIQKEWLSKDGKNSRGWSTPFAFSDEYRDKIPEIEKASQFAWAWQRLLKYKEVTGQENSIYAVSNEFLTMFSFEMLQGNPETALSGPNSMVITESKARKYFGDEDPLGKTISVDGEFDFTITGVLKDIPQNSTIRFDILVPIAFSRTIGAWYDEWDRNSIQNYALLKPNTNIEAVNEKATAILRDHLYKESRDKDPTGSIERSGVVMAPVKYYHLKSWSDNHTGLENIQYVYIFSVIAIFILIIASINFMNLSIARSLKRARDVGIRKVSGASRFSIMKQYFGESLLFTSLALIIALVLVTTLLPLFSSITGKDITLDFYRNMYFWIILCSVIVVTVLLSGGYPALLLSSFKPVKVLKGNKINDPAGLIFRKGLVIFQFVISILLILGTILVNKQLDFLRNKNLGLQKDEVVYIELPEPVQNSKNPLVEQLQNSPLIKSVAYSECLPTNIGSNTGGFYWEGCDPTNEFMIWVEGASYDYFKTLDINFVEGRPFSPDFVSDQTAAIIINETAKKEMGLETAVGVTVNFWNYRDAKIIGVVKDFNFRPLQEPIEPLMFICNQNWDDYLMMKVNMANIDETRKFITKTWNKTTNNAPLDIRFLDNEIQHYYDKEAKTAKLLKAFSLVTILISCLGLFGLSSFMVQNRTKEIGVRKVNGAKILEVLALINIDFIKWVIIAFIIASPLAYYAIAQWLNNFAYKTTINWWVFISSGILVLFLALLTVSWQSLRAATKNPIEALRYE